MFWNRQPEHQVRNIATGRIISTFRGHSVPRAGDEFFIRTEHWRVDSVHWYVERGWTKACVHVKAICTSESH